MRPTAVIDNAVFVFDGHFDVPLPAALSHTNEAAKLADAGRPDEALKQAQIAAELAPRSVGAQSTLGDMLMRSKRPKEARKAFQTALAFAETIEPEYQKGAAEGLRATLIQKN